MILKNKAMPMPYEESEYDGDVVIFLHGYPNNHYLWKKQITLFQEKLHILNFNLPGSLHGLSETESVDINYIEQQIKIKMLEILSKNPNKKFILIGHDLGCFILEEIGKQMPEHIAAQIFISGMGLSQFSSRIKSITQWLKSFYILLIQIPGFSKIILKYLKNMISRHIYRTLNSNLQSEAPNGFFPIFIYKELFRKVPGTLLKQETQSEIPTLFIFGQDDSYLNLPDSKEVERFYKTGFIKILKGGHWINRERPDEVNSIIKIFINKLSPSQERCL